MHGGDYQCLRLQIIVGSWWTGNGWSSEGNPGSSLLEGAVSGPESKAISSVAGWVPWHPLLTPSDRGLPTGFCKESVVSEIQTSHPVEMVSKYFFQQCLVLTECLVCTMHQKVNYLLHPQAIHRNEEVGLDAVNCQRFLACAAVGGNGQLALAQETKANGLEETDKRCFQIVVLWPRKLEPLLPSNFL